VKIRLVLILSLFVTAPYALGQNDSNSSEELHPFFKAMNFTQRLELPMSSRVKINLSDVIVRGEIDSVTEGRILAHPEDGLMGPRHTAVIKVKVIKAIKGDVGEYVYFEYSIGGIPAEYYSERIYKEPILLMLMEIKLDDAYTTITHSPNGLMHEVDTLYELTSQSSLMFVRKSTDSDIGEIGHPLDEHAEDFGGMTLSETERLVEEIKNMTEEEWEEEYIRIHSLHASENEG